MAFRKPSDPSTELARVWRHHRTPKRLTSLFCFEGAPHAGSQDSCPPACPCSPSGTPGKCAGSSSRRSTVRPWPAPRAPGEQRGIRLEFAGRDVGVGPFSPLRTAERARASFTYFHVLENEEISQATKSQRWMPWRQMPMKDVDGCDKPRGAAYQASIRGSLNGETRQGSCLVTPA